MTDAFIYDHLRSPRGRGKVDGSLHEVQTVNLASQVLKGLRERNNLDPELVDDVVMGCVDPIGEAGGDVARISALLAGYGDNVPGIQINRFCASGLDAVNFAAAEVMSRAARHDDRRRRRIDEPRRHRCIRRRVVHGSDGGDPDLFHAAGHLGRSDRDQVRFLARRRRCLCGGKPEARGGSLGRRSLQEFHPADQGRQRHHVARSRRAHASDHDHAVAGIAEAGLRRDGSARRLRRGGDATLSRSRRDQPRASRRQFVRHRRWRGGRADRQCSGREGGRV